MPAELTFNPVGDHSANLDISSVVTLSKPSNATMLLIQALTQNARLTLDGGTAPSATTGFQVKAGDPPAIIYVGNGTVKVIQEVATCSPQYQWGQW